MLKQWRGKARTFGTSAWNRFRIFWMPLSGRQKLAYLGALVVVLVVIIGATVAINRVLDNRITTKPLPTPEQGIKDNLEGLLSTPPKNTDTKQAKATYYKRLAIARADTKNYKAAAAAIDKQAAADITSITYFDYTQQAMYYHLGGDDVAAKSSLDKAVRILPTQDDPDKGYYVDIVRHRIDILRQGYGG